VRNQIVVVVASTDVVIIHSYSASMAFVEFLHQPMTFWLGLVQEQRPPMRKEQKERQPETTS